MGTEVGGGAVEDIETIALELVALRGVRLDGWEPWRIKHLDEGLYVVGREEGRIEDGGERPEVECACLVLGGRGEDLVHGGAHGLHDLWGKVVEANHGWERRWGCVGTMYSAEMRDGFGDCWGREERAQRFIEEVRASGSGRDLNEWPRAGA